MKPTKAELIAELKRNLRKESHIQEYDRKVQRWVPTAIIKKKTIRAVIRELETK